MHRVRRLLGLPPAHRPTHWPAGAVVLALLFAGYLLNAGREAAAKAPVTDPPASVPEAVVKQVKATVPAGWAVEAKGDRLLVRRKDQVEVEYFPPNAPWPVDGGTPPKHTSKEEYVLTLRFGPRLDEDAYRRRLEEVAKLRRECEAMRERMRYMTHKFDDYIPDTPEDRKLVEAFKEMAKKLDALRPPDYFTAEHSIHLDANPLGYFGHFASRSVEDECTLVRSKVTTLFDAHGQSPKTRQAVKALKANLGAFELELRYWHGDGVRGPRPSSLTLTTVEGVKNRADDWPVVRLSEAEAVRVIDRLAEDGTLGGASDLGKGNVGPPAGPCYVLRVLGGKEARYQAFLGWDRQALERLDSLAGALRGDAAKEMDKLRVNLSENRERQGRAGKALPARSASEGPSLARASGW